MYPKTNNMNKTLGESRVRVDFNVTASTQVDNIKRSGADFINLIEGIALNVGELQSEEELKILKSEFMRLRALAMTAIEEGTMWAVKSATI